LDELRHLIWESSLTSYSCIGYVVMVKTDIIKGVYLII